MKEELIKMGIYPNMKGFNYILEAVELKNNMQTCHIYKTLAEKYIDKPSRVERAIRYAIEIASRSKRYKESFYTDRRLTNGEFLGVMAMRYGE